jgi:hypothetical protein
MKLCSKCKRSLPSTLEHFTRCKKTKSGLSSHCKDCNKSRFKKFYEENKEREADRRRQQKEYKKEYNKQHRIINRQYYRDKERQYRLENPEQTKVKDALKLNRRRARKQALDSTFTKEQWKTCVEHFDNRCAYCGKQKPLTQEHFIPVYCGGEYTVNNIIPCCSLCNCKKNNSDFFEWYPKQKFYSKKRETTILKYLNYNNNHIQQLSIL